MRADRIVLIVALAAMGLAGGCTIWFLANQDPAGLACADTSPFCLEGYTCIDGLCLRAAAVGEGQSCAGDEECEEGLVCTNAFEPPCNGELNCELGAVSVASADTTRCHRTCNPNGEVRDQCSLGERCHPDLSGNSDGWCQSGTCTTPTDCGSNPDNGAANVCLGGDVNPGGTGPGSGLCLEGCNPLDCNPIAGCAGCTPSPNPNTGGLNVMGCEPFVVPSNVACIEAGEVEHDGTCDGVGNFCKPGSWCNIAQGQTVGYCAKWCRLPAGQAPACNAAHPTCNQVAGATFGFCS